MKRNLALGVDIGGTNSVFGLCDEYGKLYFEESVSTTDYSTPEELVDKIYERIKSVGHLPNVEGIGIGAPNGNFYSGTIEFAPNLKWKGIIPLARLFEYKFKVKTILTNDANAAAIGEMIYGAGRDLKDFVTITLGTGLGSGVISGGNLIYGHDGFAGEYGHIRVVPDGRLCGCGRKGCLETYVSATGVVRSIHELDSKHSETSELINLKNPEASQVFQLAEDGDEFAVEIIEYTAKVLGNSLADFTCFSSSKAYILFGGIAQNGPSFAKKVKGYMEDALLNIYKDKIEIRISELHDKNAAVLGASSLVWNELS
jgi:glucokinase